MAVMTISFFSQALHRNTELTAIVPVEGGAFPGPKADANAPLRSLYLLHGYGGNHPDWLRGSSIDQLAQKHRIAVFCPAAENSFYLDDLTRDCLYDQFVCKELVDVTRKLFPLSDKREDTAIGGLSMGGYGAFHGGLLHHDTFGAIIALSSALIADGLSKMPDDAPATPAKMGGMGMGGKYFSHTFGKPSEIEGSDADIKALASRVLQGGGPRPRIYQACGAQDFLIENNRAIHQYLESIGYDHMYTEGDGTHSWEYWNKHITRGLDWFLGNELKD